MAGELISEAPPTVLVIEDYRDTRTMLSTFLRRYGYGVLEAENGKEGLLKAREAKPAIVVIDLAMPELDGIEVIRQIRATPELSRTLIYAMSAYLNVEVIADAFVAGCNDVFAKPLDIDDLMDTISESLAVDSVSVS